MPLTLVTAATVVPPGPLTADLQVSNKYVDLLWGYDPTQVVDSKQMWAFTRTRVERSVDGGAYVEIAVVSGSFNWRAVYQDFPVLNAAPHTYRYRVRYAIYSTTARTVFLMFSAYSNVATIVVDSNDVVLRFAATWPARQALAVRTEDTEVWEPVPSPSGTSEVLVAAGMNNAGSPNQLVRLSVDGVNWLAPSTGFEGAFENPTSLATSGAVVVVAGLLLATADPLAFENLRGLIVSADGGMTWSAPPTVADGAYMLAAHAAAGNGALVVAFGPNLFTGEGWVARASESSPSVWSAVPVPEVAGGFPFGGLFFVDGMFVLSYQDAVPNSYIKTSVDGTTWSAPRLVGNFAAIQGLASDGTTWVAVTSDLSAPLTNFSTDHGVTWSNGNPLVDYGFYRVAYHGGVWVASKVQNTGAMLHRSTDGLNFTPVAADPFRDSASKVNILDVNWAKGKWWATGYRETSPVLEVASSVDGDRWVKVATDWDGGGAPVGETNRWAVGVRTVGNASFRYTGIGAARGTGGRWVTGGYRTFSLGPYESWDGPFLASSGNLEDWALAEPFGAVDELAAVRGPEVGAVAYSPDLHRWVVARSTDGAFGGQGRFVAPNPAMPYPIPNLAYSNDGLAWTVLTGSPMPVNPMGFDVNLSIGSSLRAAAWGGGQFVIGGQGTVITATTSPLSFGSSGGANSWSAGGSSVTWTGSGNPRLVRTITPPGSGWFALAFQVTITGGVLPQVFNVTLGGRVGTVILPGPGTYQVLCQAVPPGSASLDIAWSTAATGVTLGSYECKTLGIRTIATSSDGVTWTVRPNPFDTPGAFNIAGRVEDLAWNGTLWVAVGYSYGTVPPGNAAIMSSSDGVTWTVRHVTDANSESPAVAWSPTLGKWLVYTQARTYESTNGLSWSLVEFDSTHLAHAEMQLRWASQAERFVLVARHTSPDRWFAETSPDGATWVERVTPWAEPEVVALKGWPRVGGLVTGNEGDVLWLGQGWYFDAPEGTVVVGRGRPTLVGQTAKVRPRVGMGRVKVSTTGVVTLAPRI